ncbi:MAG: hypothetical protein II873_11710 [Oscillospiraceae bacterium]|nr:hypothetical protein [Oscillospiraceae bacterium]
MGSCPDGEAVRGGGRLTARERQAPEKKERSDYRSDDPPKGRLRRVSAGGKGAEVEANGGGEAEQVQRR